MADEAIAPAGAEAGGRGDNFAQAGERARRKHSSLRAPRKASPPLNVRGDAFAALCAAVGYERNGELSAARRYRSGRRGSFCADLAKGRWFDHEAGVGGAAVELVIHTGAAHDFESAAAWLRKQSFADAAPHLQRDAERQRRDAEAAERERIDREARAFKARGIWRTTLPVAPDTLAANYLGGRAIPAPWPASLRFAPCLWNVETSAYLPALVAAVTSLDAPNDVCAIHRTWLAESGCRAELATPKAALGAIAGCGVMLGEIDDAVVVAEGVETALSAGRALSLPAVASLGCANLRRLKIPARVRRVLIAPDRDVGGAGERAARDLAKSLLQRGVSVALAWPPQPFDDWNDAAQDAALADGGARV